MSLKEIIARIKEEGDAEIAKTREHYESRVKEIEKKHQEEREKFYQAELEKIERDKEEIKRGILLSAKLEQRKIVLKAKKDLVNNVFSQVKASFKEIIGAEAYYKFLKENASKVVEDDDILYLSAADLKEFSSKLKTDLSKKVEIKEGSLKAGFILEKPSYNLNFSIEALLEEKKEELEKEVGVKLNVL